MCEGKGYVLGPVVVQADEDNIEDTAPPHISDHPHSEGSDHEVLAPIDGVVEGSFPCERCNGEGVEAAWFQECQECIGSGQVSGNYGEEMCPKCLGRGYHKP
jgi:DnaJ-class molecular chaperone